MAKRKNSKPRNVCKLCGKEFDHPDKRQAFCSQECLSRRKELTKTKVSCTVCGKELVRWKNDLNKRNKFACSDKCQRSIAGMAGRDWALRSKKARAEYSRKSRRDRLARNPWLAAVKRKLKRHHIVDLDSWEHRVRVRLNGMRGRVSRKRVDPKHSRTVDQAIRKIRNKRKYFEQPDWQKKVAWKLSSHKARRSKKNETKRIKAFSGGPYCREDQKQWTQMRFEWMVN